MDNTQRILDSIESLRREVQEYRNEATATRTDVAWIKRVVFGGFALMSTVFGGYIVGK